LSPDISRSILINHVKDGIEIAKKYRLPIQVEMAIPQHHGTRVQKYFYTKALEIDPNTKIEDFKYPGPRPKTKEMGILMLADVVEASSKSLKQPTVDNLKRVIQSTVIELFEEGELDETGLTVDELKTIIDSFTKVFETLSNQRIEYPAVDEKSEDFKLINR